MHKIWGRANLAKTIVFALFDAATGIPLYSGTAPIAGDVKISKDGAGFVNTTNLPAEIATSSGVWSLVLTAAEMNAKEITIQCEDQAGGPDWFTQVIQIQTYGFSTAEWPFELQDQQPGVDIRQVDGVASNAVRLSDILGNVEIGAVQASPAPTLTSFKTDLTTALDNAYKNRRFIFASGNLKFTEGFVIAYNGTTFVFTTTNLGIAPAAADKVLFLV